MKYDIQYLSPFISTTGKGGYKVYKEVAQPDERLQKLGVAKHLTPISDYFKTEREAKVFIANIK